MMTAPSDGKPKSSNDSGDGQKVCELKACRSKQPAVVSVNENIGDGSWRTDICQPCADRLGLKDGDDLPGARP